MGDQIRDRIVEKHEDLPAEKEQLAAPMPAEAPAPPATDQGEGEATDSIVGEFLLFLKEEKKWWLAPLVVVLLALSAIIMFAEGSAIAPFIYTIF